MVNFRKPAIALLTIAGAAFSCTYPASAVLVRGATEPAVQNRLAQARPAQDRLAPEPSRALPVQWKAPGPGGASSSGWHLVRTPGPDKTGDIVSMMRTADLLNSDLDFAGMAIRCQEGARPQIAFVLVTPVKPRSKTRITVTTGPAPVSFDGIVIGPGTMVGLPDEAAPLLQAWQTAKTLKVEIASEDLTVKGAVPLAGLAEAVTRLETSCSR